MFWDSWCSSWYIYFFYYVAVVGYLATGLLDKDTSILVLVGVAPALIGFGIASIIVKKISEARYRTVILVIIISSGLGVLVKGAAGLLG